MQVHEEGPETPNHTQDQLCAYKAVQRAMYAEVQATPDTRLPKWSSTLKRSEGKMPPLGKLVMGSSWLSEALMAAASLARSPPNPRVELLPSQSAQLLGVVLPLLAASASA